MSNRTQYVINSIVMQVVAMLYLYIIDLRVMQPAQLPWKDDFGLFMLVPFLMLIAYGWFMLGLAIICDDATVNKLASVGQNLRVMANDGHWEAKAVHSSSKFPSL